MWRADGRMSNQLQLLIVLNLLSPGVFPMTSEQLGAQLDAEVRGKALAAADLAGQVLDLASGQMLWSRRGGEARIPASNQKVVTSCAALTLLGPEHRLETSVHLRGAVHTDGTLEGDLIIKGAGDPNLSGRFFDGDITFVLRDFASRIREAGIRRVQGPVVLDAHCFDDQVVHEAWPMDQLRFWYEAPVCGLNLNDGCVDVVVEATRAGELARVRCEPEGWLQVATRVKTRPRGQRAQNGIGLDRADLQTVQVTGWIREGSADYRGYITVQDPVRFFGVMLRRELEGQGVTLAGGVAVASAPVDCSGLRCLARTVSHVSSLVQVANTSSQNLYAECLLKELGARVEGEGSWPGGARAVGRYLQRFGEVAAPFVVDDGSGLSRRNRVTAAGMVGILQAILQTPAGEIFVGSLARSGETGSLRKRMRGSGERGRIAAKTGHLSDVNTLSGYVLDREGEPRLAFSLLGSGFLRDGVSSPAVGQGLDALCRILLRYVDGW